jgi:hypothetical protein
MNIRTAFSALLFIALAAVPACANASNPHFFPRMHPLFAGFDETKVRPGAKAALAEAKADFLSARRGKAPQFAQYVSTIPYTHSRVYQGKGYQITLVSKDLVYAHFAGPQIVLEAGITGGQPFAYDEIESLD